MSAISSNAAATSSASRAPVPLLAGRTLPTGTRPTEALIRRALEQASSLHAPQVSASHATPRTEDAGAASSRIQVIAGSSDAVFTIEELSSKIRSFLSLQEINKTNRINRTSCIGRSRTLYDQLAGVTNLSIVQIRDYQRALGLPIEAVLHHCGRVKHVQCAELSFPRDHDLLQILAKQLPSLTSFDFQESDITNAALVALAEHYPKMTSINLLGCRKLTHVAINALASKCKELLSVNLERGPCVTNTSLEAFAIHCKGLTSINLGLCRAIEDTGIRMLAENCKELTFIDLEACEGLGDHAIVPLAINCKKLTSINLAFLHQLSDDAIQFLAENCNGLTSINLGFCRSLTDASLKALASNCKGLAFINLRGCDTFTKDAIENLVSQCPKIRIKQ